MTKAIIEAKTRQLSQCIFSRILYWESGCLVT